MSLSTLFNQISATERKALNLDAVMAGGCSFINWHYSWLYSPELAPLREQSKDYSSNECLSRKNAELQPKLNSGRYKTKLVVPR